MHQQDNTRYQIHEIVNKFNLAGDKFISEMHLRQRGFTYSACETFSKNKKKQQKFKETGDSQYIYQKGLDKTCFQHDMAYGDFTNLLRKTASDKVLCNKAFNISINSKYDGYQRGLASMVYKIYDKKSSGGGIKDEKVPNQQLVEELQKRIDKTIGKGKVCSSFIDNN